MEVAARVALVVVLVATASSCAVGTLSESDDAAVGGLRIVSWDPLVEADLDDEGEIDPRDPHLARDGTWLENWAIEHYGRPGAAIVPGHTHVYPQPWDEPDPYGNPTEHERQHAFGETLNGVYVRLASRGPFDLVSIAYRTRRDASPEHVSSIPDADPDDVEILIATELGVPTTAWHRHPTGMPFDVAMERWAVLRPTELRNVTGVFITSTGNVSIDDIALRPR